MAKRSRSSISPGCSGFDQTRASRRDFIRVGSLAGLGICLGDSLRLEAAQKWFESKEGKARSVIQVVLPGGIAAQESWNPKPEAPLEYRGPFGVNKTKIPGIVFSEPMKECAKIADKMCVIRSLVGKEADHGRAMYAMLTGNRMSPAVTHPGMGAIVNHEFGPRKNLPGYITVPSFGINGSGTGYLNPKYGAFSVGGDPADGKAFQVRDLRLPAGVDDKLFDTRRGLLDVVNNEFRKLEADPRPLETMDAFYQQAYTMISSEEVRNAFDLSQEPQSVWDRYGYGKFSTYGNYGSRAGMRCLLARRLVEAGARFVTVTYGAWDTHTRLRENYNEQMPAIDHGIATLITDLEERGLLDSTLVWVVSEFGRTPKINASAGRDHYARVFSAALAGGGLNKGIVYGDSDATSSEPSRNPVPLIDLHATIYNLIGINSEKELMAPGARPMEIVDGGHVVDDLIA